MGYYTYFTLRMQDGSDLPADIDDTFYRETDYEFNSRTLAEGYLHAKWYDWEEQMLKISLYYPTLIFELEGDGESSGDYWICYFHNGSIQKDVLRRVKDPCIFVTSPTPKAYPLGQVPK